MARPKKHPDETRTERFNLRFTVAERAHVDAQAQIAGLDTHEYLRRRVLEYKVPTGAARQVDPKLIKTVNDLGTRLQPELRAIGNNANQLARAAHTGRPERISWEIVTKRAREACDDLSRTLERLVLD